jgi:hypothetical protein
VLFGWKVTGEKQREEKNGVPGNEWLVGWDGFAFGALRCPVSKQGRGNQGLSLVIIRGFMM